MSQNDFVIDNQTASAVRSDLNSAFQALASLSSGTSEPATKYANMLWYDTTNNILKMRNEANNAWVNLFYLDQTNALVHVLENTEVANTSGTLIGKLGVHANSVWTTGTNTEKRLVSPAQVKAAIDTLVASTFASPSTATWEAGTDTNETLVTPAQVNAAIQALSLGTVWTDRRGSRAFGTIYQNTNGYRLMVHVGTPYNSSILVSASSDMSSPVVDVAGRNTVLVPTNYYYQVTDDAQPEETNSITIWSELDNG